MLEPEVQTADANEVAPRSDAPPEAPEDGATEGALLEEDLLVEDVSIDGMCGVY